MSTMPPEREPEDPAVLEEWLALHAEETAPEVEGEPVDDEEDPES